MRRWKAAHRAQGAAGFATPLWTCPRIATVVARRFAVRYHVSQVSRILGTLGWSPQQPARRALERHEAAIARWVKTCWPQVKKTPRAGGPRSSSRRATTTRGWPSGSCWTPASCTFLGRLRRLVRHPLASYTPADLPALVRAARGATRRLARNPALLRALLRHGGLSLRLT